MAYYELSGGDPRALEAAGRIVAWRTGYLRGKFSVGSWGGNGHFGAVEPLVAYAWRTKDPKSLDAGPANRRPQPELGRRRLDDPGRAGPGTPALLPDHGPRISLALHRHRRPPLPRRRGRCLRASKRRKILTVGRFFVGGHAKRHDVLISAFKSICDRFDEPVEFHLAGSSTPGGEHMDYLAALKASAVGHPIYFHVNCSEQDLQGLYRDALVYWHGAGIGRPI